MLPIDRDHVWAKFWTFLRARAPRSPAGAVSHVQNLLRDERKRKARARAERKAQRKLMKANNE